MDSTAFSLCMDNKIPIMVFDMNNPNVRDAVLGEKSARSSGLRLRPGDRENHIYEQPTKSCSKPKWRWKKAWIT